MNLKQLERILELTDQISIEIANDTRGSYRIRKSLTRLVNDVEREIARILVSDFRRGKIR